MSQLRETAGWATDEEMKHYRSEVSRIQKSAAQGICPFCKNKIVRKGWLSLGHRCSKCSATFD